MSIHDRAQILERAVEFFGQEHQIKMAIEEMAELIQALSKYGRDAKYKSSVLEEMADVQIMLDQLKIIFGNPESDDKFKLGRLKGLMERGESSA